MNPMQAADRLLYAVLTRSWPPARVDEYLAKLRVDSDTSPIPGVVNRTFQMIDGKAAALLTHTSMMVAALGVTSAVVADTFNQQAVVVFEIVVYLVISLLCLRCISIFHEPPEFDNDTLSAAARDELILRRGLYTLCNKMTIYLTFLVLVSLPVLFLI